MKEMVSRTGPNSYRLVQPWGPPWPPHCTPPPPRPPPSTIKTYKWSTKQRRRLCVQTENRLAQTPPWGRIPSRDVIHLSVRRVIQPYCRSPVNKRAAHDAVCAVHNLVCTVHICTSWYARLHNVLPQCAAAIRLRNVSPALKGLCIVGFEQEQ